MEQKEGLQNESSASTNYIEKLEKKLIEKEDEAPSIVFVALAQRNPLTGTKVTKEVAEPTQGGSKCKIEQMKRATKTCSTQVKAAKGGFSYWQHVSSPGKIPREDLQPPQVCISGASLMMK